MKPSVWKTFGHGKAHLVPGVFVSGATVFGLSAGEDWWRRGIAVACFWVAALTFIASIVAGRRFRFIGPRLADRSLKVRLTVEALLRTGFLALLVYLAPTTLYLLADLRDIHNGASPVVTEAKVLQVYSNGLTWWMTKGVDLETTDGKRDHYSLDLYPVRPIEGARYRIIVLPKSKCVLSLRRIANGAAVM